MTFEELLEIAQRSTANPFVESVIPEYPKEDLQGVKKYTRAAVRGATLGLVNRDDPNQDLGTMAAEFLGSIPTAVGTGMIAAPLAGAGAARLGLQLGRAAKQLAGTGIVSTGIGTGKALQSGDLTDIPAEIAWNVAADAAGLGIGKYYRKLRKFSSAAPDEVLGPQRVFGREVDGEIADRRALPEAAFRAEPLIRDRGPVIDAEEFTILPPREIKKPPLRLGMGEKPAFEAPESSLTRQARIDEQAALQKQNQIEAVDEIINPGAAGLGDIRLPALSEPVTNLMPEQVPGPAPRFVRSSTRPQNLDDYGIDIFGGGYFKPDWNSEFKIGRIQDDLPNLNSYVADPNNRASLNTALLTIEVDPKTGFTTYIPIDNDALRIADHIGILPRRIEPSLDKFQREALSLKEQNVAKLDPSARNEVMKTSNLIKLTDQEIENLTNVDDPWKPIKFVTIEDSSLAKETKELMAKAGFSEDDIERMTIQVDQGLETILAAEINKNLSPKEIERARQHLWYTLITKEMKPC